MREGFRPNPQEEAEKPPASQFESVIDEDARQDLVEQGAAQKNLDATLEQLEAADVDKQVEKKRDALAEGKIVDASGEGLMSKGEADARDEMDRTAAMLRLEQAFMDEGDEMTAAHERGETFDPKTEAGRAGARKEWNETMDAEQHDNRDATVAFAAVGLEAQWSVGEQLAIDRLRALGVGTTDDEIERAALNHHSPLLGKTRRLFGGIRNLFNKAARERQKEIDEAFEQFKKATETSGGKGAELNEAKNLLKDPHARQRALASRNGTPTKKADPDLR